MKIIDYSWWRPDPNALRQAGITSVCRYLGYGGKVIDKAEYDALHAAGISVMLNWETTGKSWREGYNTGVNEGREARRQARALGHPDERPIIQRRWRSRSTGGVRNADGIGSPFRQRAHSYRLANQCERLGRQFKGLYTSVLVSADNTFVSVAAVKPVRRERCSLC
jgi:hypothetical protein